MLVSVPVLAAALLASSPAPRDPSGPAGNVLRLSSCAVLPISDVDVPAREAGVLLSLALEDGTPVKEGLTVKRGQLLGKLNDADALAKSRAAQLEHQVAQADEKKSRASVEAANKTVQVAQAEVEESEWINKRSPGSIAPTQLRRQHLTEDRARSEAEVASREAETATLTIQLREAQMVVANLSLDRHRIESPLDGMVVDVKKDAGEWVSLGDPILRIVHLDKLRVRGKVKIGQLLPEQAAGRNVRVEATRQGQTETFEGVVSFVSPMAVADSYEVWAEVPNRQINGYPVLLPGMTVDMLILMDPARPPGSPR